MAPEQVILNGPMAIIHYAPFHPTQQLLRPTVSNLLKLDPISATKN